ncbi:MAG: class I SAM-dependent methyltransferase, partial [Chloroflexi bacterium]|nr:class I SAM-dependent methyltransferase [Chloroflexota bacterium]
MNTKRETQRKSFDRVAELYDRYRPAYPEPLIEFILSASAIPPGGRILEIGSGPGKATLAFARRGYAMLCIEPGQNLAALAAKKVAGFPGVSFAVTRFEDWQETPGEFDLVISASAFHWVTPEIGYAKASRALKPGGSLALFWNMQGEYDAEIDRLYEKIATSLREHDREPLKERIRKRAQAIEASGYFSKVIVKRSS